jgi:LysR family transcriptional regulator, nod-box dependent transcriptional activator
MHGLPLTSVDLNLLVALDALLAERSVTRAGARLSLTQPAMSHALARLRRQFDDELLVRSGREMVPTAFALTLREPLRDALAAVERTLAARPTFDPAVDERVFRVYANDYLTLVLLAPLLRELPHEAPGVRLEVTSQFTSFAELLQDEGLDLLISPGELPGSEHLPSVRLFSDRFVLVGGPQAPGLQSGRVSRAAFAQMPYLVYRQGGATSFADAQMDARGIERRVALTVGSFVLVPHLLAGSALVTMLQERLLGTLDHDLQVARPPVALEPIVERAYWHPRSEADPAHRWLRERLVAAARALD